MHSEPPPGVPGEFVWAELLRPEWSGPGTTLLVRCYQTLLPDSTTLAVNPTAIDLTDWRLVLHVGPVRYLSAGEIGLTISDKRPDDSPGTTDPKVTLYAPEGRWHVLPRGVYAFVVTPKHPGADPVSEEILDVAVGSLVALEDRRLLYHFRFDLEVKPGTPDELTARPTPFLVTRPVPADVTPCRLALLQELDRRLNDFDSDTRNRVRLSLRWVEMAHASHRLVEHADLYVMYWIALEALAMPGDSDIRPLEDTLERIYSITREDVRNEFNVGRLFGLRGRIVHDGHRPIIRRALLDYVEALYCDVLFDLLGLPSEHRAREALGVFDLQAELVNPRAP